MRLPLPRPAALAALAVLCLLPLPAAEGPRREPPPRPLFPNAAPVIPWQELRQVKLPNTVIESVALDEAEGSVRITAIVSHPPATDRVKVWVALPLRNWNGRFRGNGGGGFVGGNPASLRGPVLQGFATAATDTGHDGGSGSFALGADGRLNWQEIRNNAYLGIHDMTLVAKPLPAPSTAGTRSTRTLSAPRPADARA